MVDCAFDMILHTDLQNCQALLTKDLHDIKSDQRSSVAAQMIDRPPAQHNHGERGGDCQQSPTVYAHSSRILLPEPDFDFLLKTDGNFLMGNGATQQMHDTFAVFHNHDTA